MTKGALLRDEMRGAHFKPEFPKRDDSNWLKTTIATFDSTELEPKISYEPVDLRHLEPQMRDYTQAKKTKPELKNVPTNIKLPI
jgi:succinate dehydrogenase / fumarate reductase flavoprotein subunit